MCRGGGGGWTLCRERRLYHQLHTHTPQRAVGVCGHVAVGHQLVAVSEVPDVVDGGRRSEVPAGVVELDFEEHVLAANENVLGLVGCGLLGDFNCNWDLI